MNAKISSYSWPKIWLLPWANNDVNDVAHCCSNYDNDDDDADVGYDGDDGDAVGDDDDDDDHVLNMGWVTGSWCYRTGKELTQSIIRRQWWK